VSPTTRDWPRAICFPKTMSLQLCGISPPGGSSNGKPPTVLLVQQFEVGYPSKALRVRSVKKLTSSMIDRIRKRLEACFGIHRPFFHLQNGTRDRQCAYMFSCQSASQSNIRNSEKPGSHCPFEALKHFEDHFIEERQPQLWISMQNNSPDPEYEVSNAIL
jgi:hypothetical protein